jgi:hypothetical protein
MSARIRNSSLLSRKYDWIFCESISIRRPRTLHTSKAAFEGRPAKPKSKPSSKRRAQKLRILKVPTGPKSSTEKVRFLKVPTKAGSVAEDGGIHRVTVDVAAKPVVRRLEVRPSPIDPTQSRAPIEDVPILRSATDEGNSVTQYVRRLQDVHISRTESDLGRAMERFPHDGSQHVRISRMFAGGFEGVNKQSYTVPFAPSTTDPATFVRPTDVASPIDHLNAYAYGETPVKPRRARLHREAVRRDRSRGSQSLAISRGSTRDQEPPNEQSHVVRFLEASAGPATPVRASTEELPPDLRSRKIGKPLNQKERLRALRRGVTGAGFKKVTTEKRPLFRKIFREIAIETSPSTEYARRHIFRKVARAVIRKLYIEPELTTPTRGLRRAKPLTTRKYLSVALKEQHFAKTEPQKVAEQAIVSQPGDLQVLHSPKIIKYDSLRLRKHLTERPRFPEPVIDLRNRRLEQQIVVGRPEGLVKYNVPTELKKPTMIRRVIGFSDVSELKYQQLAIERPQNLVIQKVLSLPKEPLEPSAKAQDSPLIRKYPSWSLYPIPTEETRMLSDLEPEREPAEQHHPANTDHWNTAERVVHGIEVATAKRIRRESWLTRNGDMRLAISLLFSSGSLAEVERLRLKYNPNKEKFGHFKVLRRLEIGKYMEYDKMLAKFVETWQPFKVKLNEPRRSKDKLKYNVGLQLEFEKLEQLEQGLLESVRSLPGRTKVNRRNTRDNHELGLMVIDGKIKDAEDAIRLMELLKHEHINGLGKIKVEGLVLHGYSKAGDSLSPPPKEFLFPSLYSTD